MAGNTVAQMILLGGPRWA